MMRVHRKKVYPTRESELPRILRVRMKGLRAIIGTNDAYNLSFELTTLEYVMLIIMYECGMNSLITYLDLVVKHGPFYIGGAYIFIMVTLTMPIYMLLTFLGSYSKKSYIKLFTCAPIFEGLGYMVGSVKLMGELFNSSMAATALLTFYHCLAGQFKANFCEGLILKNGNDLRCLSKYPRFLYHIPCQKEADTRFLTTTQYYFIKLLNHSYDETTPPKLNNNLVVSSFLIWTLIFAMALGGIKRLKTLTTNLQFVCGFVVILTVLVAISHAHPRFEIRARSFGEISCLFSFEFWSDLFVYAVQPTGFGNIIWLATIKPKSIDPKFAIILTSLIKIVLFSLLTCISSLICQDILYHLKIVDQACLFVTGFDIIFAFVPDVLFQSGVRRLIVPTWYLAVFYFSFITPLYSVLALTDSITQRFPVLNRYKFYVCLLISAGSFVLNLTLLTTSGGFVIAIYKRCSFPFLATGLLLFFNVALFFAYSHRSILDDYLFTYGVIPEKYWLTFWKSSPIFAIFAFIFVIYNQYEAEICSRGNYVVIFVYLHTFFMFAPVVVLGIARCCSHLKTADVAKLSKPDNEWGPYDPVDKENRLMYFPHREIRYRTKILKCKHRCCCAYPSSYQKRLRIEHVKLDKLQIRFHKEVEEKVVTNSVISSDSSMKLL